MSRSTLFDPGLQPERTELAWRRTALSIGIGSIVAARLLPLLLGHAVWALPGILGAVFAGAIWWAARRRGAAYTRALARPSAGPLPGGGLMLVLASACALTGMLGAAVIAVALMR